MIDFTDSSTEIIEHRLVEFKQAWKNANNIVQRLRYRSCLTTEEHQLYLGADAQRDRCNECIRLCEEEIKRRLG